MKRLLTILVCGLLSVTMTFADGPFRNHRFDSFKTLPAKDGNIVFIGNSITDMHCWPEAFKTSTGEYLPIVNRGNSGTFSTEQSDNIESYLLGKPKKVFIMIGTNDISKNGLNFTGEQVLTNIKSMVDRIHMRYPDTRIYLYCILNNNTAQRVEEVWLHANEVIKEYVETTNAEWLTYIDLYDALTGIAQGGNWSYDKLHLAAGAYQVWCKNICKYLQEGEEYTVSTVYPDNTLTAQNNGNMGSTAGMRATYFSMLPISNDDVLIFGDEMIKNGEWQELLGNYNVKNRGTGWGYGGDIATTSKIVDATYADTGVEKKDAKAIFIYTGTADCNNTNTALESIKTSYKALVDKIAQKSPTSIIYLMGLCPTTNSSNNTSRISVLNEYMKTLESEKKIRYVDTYTPLLNGNVANTKYFYPSDYLGGLGYVKIANLMQAALTKDFPNDKYSVMSEDDAAKQHTQAGLRNSLSQVMARGMTAERGTSIGMYDNDKMQAFDAKLKNANDLLAKDEVTEEEIETLKAQLGTILDNALTMPKASNEEEEQWYQFTSMRSPDRYISAEGEAAGVSGKQNTANNAVSMWKFVEREDKTFDIINRKYGSYMSPASDYNTQIRTTKAQPQSGWTISHSNTPTYYIISSGDVQLNQTQDGLGYALYNWSDNANMGSDRSDQGCQLKILEVAPGELPEEPVVEIPQAVLTLTETELSGNAPYMLTADDAAKVFALESYTIALDVTLNATMSGRGAFVCAADPSQPATEKATPTSTPYFAYGHYGSNLAHLASTKAGDRFTASPASLSAGQNTKIAFTVSRTSKGSGVLGFYIDGMKKHEMTYPANNYELPAFCDIKANHPNANIYIGGGMAGNEPFELGNGIINSVKFFNGVLTAEQIAALAGNDNLEYETEVEYSTEGYETWYYIVSAATKTYCAKKAIKTNGNGPLTYKNVALDPSMIWCFEKNADGKVAIRNYDGKYMSKNQDKNHADAGLTDVAHYNYTITPWNGEAGLPNAFTIKSDASNQPIHAQEDNVVIVTWAAENNGASLWSLQKLTPEELESEMSIKNLSVEHCAMGVGIGGKDYAMLRLGCIVTGLKGEKELEAISGSVNSDNVSNIRAYRSEDIYEYYKGKSNCELLGTGTPDNDGNFEITFTSPMQIKNGSSEYIWIVADIKDTAEEGDIIDSEILAYTVDGKKQNVSNGNPANNAIVFLSASTVEYLNTYGSRYYRIPAITTAKNGWLVAVTDKRWGSNGDLPNNIDVVARVSKDKGVTWSEPVVIAGTPELGGDYGHGDPAIVTDMVTGDIHVLVCSKMGFFYGTPTNPQLIKVITSHDNGETWDAPVDITNQLYGAGCSDSERSSIHSLFPSSGSFMQKRDGTLMCVAPTRPTSNTTHSTFQARIISSTDHGKTWTLSNNYAMLDADESKIVELDNGDLLVASRHGGNRYYATSSNNGASWSERSTWSDLVEPACNGDMIRLTSLSAGDDKNRLLHSIPNASSRKNVTVFLSTDEGKTWPVKKSICPKGSAYSSLTVLNDGTIGCYYEEDGLEGGYQMRYVRFSLEWLTNGNDSIESDNFETGIKCIEEIVANSNNNAVYDLQGRNVLTLSKGGIYIVNGKKMIMK